MGQLRGSYPNKMKGTEVLTLSAHNLEKIMTTPYHIASTHTNSCLSSSAKREKSTSFPRSEIIFHRSSFYHSPLDCPSKIVMIADRCSSFKVQDRHARKTREKRWH